MKELFPRNPFSFLFSLLRPRTNFLDTDCLQSPSLPALLIALLARSDTHSFSFLTLFNSKFLSMLQVFFAMLPSQSSIRKIFVSHTWKVIIGLWQSKSKHTYYWGYQMFLKQNNRIKWIQVPFRVWVCDREKERAENFYIPFLCLMVNVQEMKSFQRPPPRLLWTEVFSYY